MVVEGGYDGEDGGSGVGGERHVAQMNFVEGRFAHAEHERAALLEGDVGGALDEVLGETVCYARERAHAAGQDDHAAGGIASAGDAGGDVSFGELMDFGGGLAEELFGEVAAPAEVEFFGHDAQGIFLRDE